MGGGRNVMRTPAGSLPADGSSCASACGEATATPSARIRPATPFRTMRGAVLLVRRASACSRIVAPVEIGKEIVAPFAVREERLVDVLGSDLVVQPSEPEDVILRPLRSVVPRGAGLHQERPVAGLREEEFPRHLPQRAIELV